MKKLTETRSFDGRLCSFEHVSESCHASMRFSIYFPPDADGKKLPWLLWLSGLTCTHENFMIKSGAQRYAAELGIALVAPDTSPRNTGIEGEDRDWDFGAGAGFYVNATKAPWSSHFKMYDYVAHELPAILTAEFDLDATRIAIGGHSMGGHGAMVVALRNPGMFRSVSAFSPICSPMRCPWGEKALSGYLGNERQGWREYDTCELIASTGNKLPLLVDQGANDEFIDEQLRPDLLRDACLAHDHPLELNIRDGYDHSYYFVASYIGDHLRYHARAMAD